MDAGIALPLFRLLSDPSPIVQTMAAATLCNIVLDFSPMKKSVMECGGVGKLVQLATTTIVGNTQSASSSSSSNMMMMDTSSTLSHNANTLENTTTSLVVGEELRLNAVWAIKNLLYQAETTIKTTVMQELGWTTLER